MALRQEWCESSGCFSRADDSTDRPDFGEGFLLEAGEVAGQQKWVLHGGDQIACDGC